MAEALLRHQGGAAFDVHSAGTEPKGVNPLTLRVLAEAGIDQTILDPRSTWADKAEYDATAQKLVQLFIDNFAQFEAHVDEGVRQAAPAPVAA